MSICALLKNWRLFCDQVLLLQILPGTSSARLDATDRMQDLVGPIRKYFDSIVLGIVPVSAVVTVLVPILAVFSMKLCERLDTGAGRMAVDPAHLSSWIAPPPTTYPPIDPTDRAGTDICMSSSLDSHPGGCISS